MGLSGVATLALNRALCLRHRIRFTYSARRSKSLFFRRRARVSSFLRSKRIPVLLQTTPKGNLRSFGFYKRKMLDGGEASRTLLLWSNIPALAAGKRAFRQLRLVCAYRNSGILPGEEMVYSGIATSVIGTNIPPSGNTLSLAKPKSKGESILMLHHRNKKGTQMGAVSVVEHQGLEPWTDRL